MKTALVLAVAVGMAMPVVSVPTSSDAQVLTGRGGRSSAPRAPRPRLSEAEQDRLAEAKDEIVQLEEWTATLEEQAKTQGALTTEQQTLLAAYAERKAAAEEIVDRLEAKLNR